MTQPAAPIKFYTFPVSGNTHRVELLLRALDLPFEHIDIDLRGKQQKTEAFLAMNPFGQVPVIDDNGTIIWDSVAILTYLALTYDTARKFLPAEPKRFAEVMAWVSKGLRPHRLRIGGGAAHPYIQHAGRSGAGAPDRHDFLHVMDEHLSTRAWLVDDTLTLADLACYAYVAHGPEGGVDLKPFENVTGWLARLEAQPFFVAMPKSKVGLWAE